MKKQDVYVERFLKKHFILTDWDNLSADAVLLVRHNHPVFEQSYVFVVSGVEPTRTFLPKNVVWFCFDQDSPYYMKVLRRTSEEPSADFKHSWVELFHWHELWETQRFAVKDLETLGMQLPNPATEFSYGTVELLEPSDETSVVVTSDPRLSDARVPLPHGHDEKPLTILADNFPVLDTEFPYIGKALLFDGTSFSWGTLTDAVVDLDG